MDTRVFCVYNLARGVFLSSKVTAVDGVNEPLKILKVLVGGLGLDAVSGLWICPLSAIPSVPRLFPFDLIYLDRDQRVVEAAEIDHGADFPPYRREVASALVLARRTILSTQTERGDRLIICVDSEVNRQIAAADASDREPVVSNVQSSAKRKGLFERNGKEKGTATSAVSREPFSRVAARVAEGVFSVTESGSTRAAAMEPPANQPAIGQAMEKVESEDGISAPLRIEMNSVEPEVGTEAEGSELERLIPNDAAAPRAIAGKPVQSANAEGAFSSEAKDAIPGETPVNLSIEAGFERPQSGNQPVVTGQQGGVEDLFSNWVDTPSSSAWMSRNPRPGNAPTVSTAPAEVASTPVEKEAHKAAPDSKISNALELERSPEAKKEVPEIATVPPKPTIPVRESKVNGTAPAQGTTPGQAHLPTATTVSQSAQVTTFTVANYGMWRVSAPTAVGPLASVPSQGDKGAAAPTVEEQASKAKETKDQEKPGPAATGSDSQTLTPSSSPRFAGPAGLSKERIRAQGAAKEREALEAEASKPGKEKAVQPPGAAMQGIVDRIAAVARRESATLKSPEPSTMGAKVSANAVPEKKLPIETANDSRAAERPKSSEASSAVKDAVQRLRPEVPPMKTGVSPQNAGSAPKSVKAVSRAVAPDKSAAPKAQPKTSVGRTEPNGKSNAGPLSLGTRFKRWLNPVVSTAGDRRRAHRRYVPGMVAHYYTGGSPKPHEVADISMTGFYLLTEDRWMPETMIQMTLQKPCAKGERKQSITILSKIVRRGSDGVAARFVMPEDLDPRSHDVQPSQATDKFTLARFL